MLFKSTAILALGASSVLAKPFGGNYRRQESSTAVDATSGAESTGAAESTSMESVSGSAAQSTATSSVEVSATDVSSVASSAASAASSVVSDGGSSSAPAATTTSMNDTGSAALAFGCPDGYSLTYVIGTSTYPGVELEQASSVLSNWTGAVPPPIEVVSSEGEGVGAMRTWTALNLTVMEELTNQTEEDDGTLMQMWNLTAPIDVSESIVITNATSDLTLYSNSTTNETSVQFFVNFCVNDQPAGLELYAQLVTVYLTGIQQLVSGGGDMGNMTSTSMSMTEAASSTAAEATSAVESSASGASDTASSAISGATDTAISGASSVLSEATGGASSVVGDATSAVESVISSLIPTRRVRV